MRSKPKAEQIVVADTVLCDILPGTRGITRKVASIGTRLPRSESERLVALPINRHAKARLVVEKAPAKKVEAPVSLSAVRTPKLVIMAKTMGLKVGPRPDRDQLIAAIEAASAPKSVPKTDAKPLGKMNRTELDAVVFDEDVELAEDDDTNKKIAAAIEKARQAK